MSLVTEVSAPQAHSKPAEEHADIAMQFFKIMYAKKHAPGVTKSPGTTHKHSTQVQSDNGAQAQAPAITGQAPVTGQAPIQDRAQLVSTSFYFVGALFQGLAIMCLVSYSRLGVMAGTKFTKLLLSD